MIDELNCPGLLGRAYEIVEYLSKSLVPDKITGSDPAQTIWSRRGRADGAVFEGPWGSNLFAQLDRMGKVSSSLWLCYRIEETGSRAKALLYNNRKVCACLEAQDAPGNGRAPTYSEGEVDAPWRVRLILEEGLRSWKEVLSVFTRKWEHTRAGKGCRGKPSGITFNKSELCAVIALASREEPESSAVEFRTLERVFGTQRGLFDHFKNFKLERDGIAEVRTLKPQHLLSHWCAELRVSQAFQQMAFEILKIVDKHGWMVSRKQATVAAAAIYYTGKHLVTSGDSRIPTLAELEGLAGSQGFGGRSTAIPKSYSELHKRNEIITQALQQLFELPAPVETNGTLITPSKAAKMNGDGIYVRPRANADYEWDKHRGGWTVQVSGPTLSTMVSA
jgi:hypothetical protein